MNNHKRLFLLRDHVGRPFRDENGIVFFNSKADAKHVRDELNAAGRKHYHVSPGPDHHNGGRHG